jgi:hypothetical protein
MKWVPYVTVVSGSAFLISSAMVFATDGDEPPVSVGLYFGAIALALAAAIGFGLTRRRGLRAVTGSGLAVLLVAWLMGVGDLLTPVFERISDKPYAGDEGPLVLLGLVLLGLGALAGRSSREPLPA